MENENKRFTLFLGMRIGTVFLVSLGIIVLAAYYVLSQNFQNLLTSYTIKLLQIMSSQGVEVVQDELISSQKEAANLAKLIQIQEGASEHVEFPPVTDEENVLRMTYVSEQGTYTSDGSRLETQDRPDIEAALRGEKTFYGPFYDEKRVYRICYSAPVRKDGKVVGAFTIEKDGYLFCKLIETLQFSNTGESYILSAEGTDIAVSRSEHLDWVTSEYNGRKLYAENPSEETLSIIQLEEKGLRGETGVGTYYWEDGLVYVVYEPIPYAGWVLLTGLREEELASMTQSVLFASISKGPVLTICLITFFLLNCLILYWIVSSMKRYMEINKKLKIFANYDSLTGLKNRNSYHEALDQLAGQEHTSIGCVYMDANGLHEINNHLGHQAGDEMLKTVADILRRNFTQDRIYRIGGDEFVVFCLEQSQEDLKSKAELTRREIKQAGYEISIGFAWDEDCLNINEMVNSAEEAMQKDKLLFYKENGRERQIRKLDHQMEQILSKKKDSDAFLSLLAPEFKGIYFVDMSKDTIRHLFIPPYFQEMLDESNHRFSKALSLYSRRVVSPEFRKQFDMFCDYTYLEKRLILGDMPELTYQKTDGSRVKLRILKFKEYTAQSQETLWLFSELGNR